MLLTTLAAASAPSFEPQCTSKNDYGWPRFETQAALSADAKWSAYFSKVYGGLPNAYPDCVYDFNFLHKDAYEAAGLHGTRPVVDVPSVKEGDLYLKLGTTGVNYGIYHGSYTPVPSHTWVEVTHAVLPTELEGAWVWRQRGSGVWYQTGRTITFPTPAEPALIHAAAIAFLAANCSTYDPSTERWPRMESDIFGGCAREKGYDSIQFEPQAGQTPVGTFGLAGMTEMVFSNIDGRYTCGTAEPRKTPLRAGWMASRACNCHNSPIPPDCGLMPFPPPGIGTVSPPLCEAQAHNTSAPCNVHACGMMKCE